MNVNFGINTAQLNRQITSPPQAANRQQSPNQTLNNVFSLSEGSLLEKKVLVRPPGFEPGSSAWQAYTRRAF